MILEIFCLLIFCTPIIWEWYQDRNGDKHPNYDWVLRGLLMLCVSVVVAIIHPAKNFWQAFVLSFAMFTVFFPYGINIIHYKRGVIENPKWWSHLSKEAVPDKWLFPIPWYGRMFFMIIILTAAIKVYVCWQSLFTYTCNP